MAVELVGWLHVIIHRWDHGAPAIGRSGQSLIRQLWNSLYALAVVDDQQQHSVSNESKSKSRPIAIRQRHAFLLFMCQSSPRLHRSSGTVAVAATTTVRNANLGIWLQKCMPDDEFSF